jgi:ABC-type transporter lipoprotein component MlaA
MPQQGSAATAYLYSKQTQQKFGSVFAQSGVVHRTVVMLPILDFVISKANGVKIMTEQRASAMRCEPSSCTLGSRR